jgi:prepilin-type N-terminal cleavage/methylation domain-containing protein/prepilin-type processing-associated H-X9-DG protein
MMEENITKLNCRTLKKFVDSKKTRAFTLIELLVVISIISLLMSIMIPGLQRAKESARCVVCKSNLKQLAMATLLYLNDYDGQIPFMRDRFGIEKGYDSMYTVKWYKVVPRYMSTKDGVFTANSANLRTKIRWCPSAPRMNKKLETAEDWLRACTYGLNWEARNHNIRQWKAPGKYYMYGECLAQNFIRPLEPGCPTWHQWGAPGRFDDNLPQTGYFIDLRHKKNTAMNMTFFDGHLETVTNPTGPYGGDPGFKPPWGKAWRTRDGLY